MENDMLSSLLSDPEALQNAMKTVSDLLGGQPSAQTEPQNAYDPASEMMQKALPVIGAIAQSGQNAVKPEKRALLGALKPFVAEEVSGQFDRCPPSGQHGSDGARGTRTGEPLCRRYRAASLIGGADPCITAILPPQSRPHRKQASRRRAAPFPVSDAR
ncbi:MAG: hypothetical protein ACLT2F_09080 [Butyricicoccus sp.]